MMMAGRIPEGGLGIADPLSPYGTCKPKGHAHAVAAPGQIEHSLCAKLSEAFYSDSPKLTGDLESLQKLDHHFEKSKGEWHPFTAFLLDELNRRMYVVFRGSKEVKDILTNSFAATTHPIPDETFLHVHGGMWIALQNCLQDICKVLISNRSSFDQIIFTGHSLGGAHAQLAHYGILKHCDKLPGIESLRNASIHVITFGAPLVFAVGDPDQRGDFENVLKPVHDCAVHYVNDLDVVPRLLGPRSGNWRKFFDDGNCWKSTTAKGGAVMMMFGAAAVVATGGLALAGASAAGAAYAGHLGARVEAYGGKEYMVGAQFAAQCSGKILEQLDSASNKSFRPVGTTILVRNGHQQRIAADSDQQRTVLSVPDGKDAYARSIKSHKVRYYVALF